MKFQELDTSDRSLRNIRLFNYRPQRSWGKVIFLQASVILLTGGGAGPGGLCSRGGGGLVLRGVLGPGGFLGLGGGGAWWRPPRDGHCCGRYASYWNAFLFKHIDGKHDERVRKT